mgnify:CR=1 FL=1
MISVVVPVYNMEKFLERCLESLISQTISDFEILLIDDGSTDKSAEICRKYVKTDERIRYIYKENGGLSDARNAAIEVAKGEYITFVDSDDYVHSTYLEYLLSLIEKYDADIASCIHFPTSEDAVLFDLSEENVFCMNGKEACKRMVTDLAPVLTAACGKLYKTAIVKKHEFPYGRLHEDVATTYKYYLEAECVVYGYRELYAYYQHPNSIMHRISDKKVEDELWAMSDRALNLQQRGEEKLASLSWEFMFKFLKRDVVNKLGNSKIWKKYGNKYISNNSRIKKKIKGYLLISCPGLIRDYFKQRSK